MIVHILHFEDSTSKGHPRCGLSLGPMPWPDDHAWGAATGTGRTGVLLGLENVNVESVVDRDGT